MKKAIEGHDKATFEHFISKYTWKEAITNFENYLAGKYFFEPGSLALYFHMEGKERINKGAYFTSKTIQYQRPGSELRTLLMTNQPFGVAEYSKFEEIFSRVSKVREGEREFAEYMTAKHNMVPGTFSMGYHILPGGYLNPHASWSGKVIAEVKQPTPIGPQVTEGVHYQVNDEDKAALEDFIKHYPYPTYPAKFRTYLADKYNLDSASIRMYFEVKGSKLVSKATFEGIKKMDIKPIEPPIFISQTGTGKPWVTHVVPVGFKCTGTADEQVIMLANAFNIEPHHINIDPALPGEVPGDYRTDAKVSGRQSDGMKWYTVTDAEIADLYILYAKGGKSPYAILAENNNAKPNGARIDVFKGKKYLRAFPKETVITLNSAQKTEVIRLVYIGKSISDSVRQVAAVQPGKEFAVTADGDEIKVAIK